MSDRWEEIGDALIAAERRLEVLELFSEAQRLGLEVSERQGTENTGENGR